MFARNLTVSIPSSSSSSLTPLKSPGREFSPPVSPSNGPIGDIECQRRDSIRRGLEILLSMNFILDSEDTECDSAVILSGREDFVRLAMEGLSDSWSEIRGDTAKTLGRHCRKNNSINSGAKSDCKYLCQPVCHLLLLSLMVNLDTESRPTWQAIHGTLLALHHLLDAATTDQQHSIQNVCLALQRHPRLPVRDAARKCFGKLLFAGPEWVVGSTGKVLEMLRGILSSTTVCKCSEEYMSPRASLDTSYCLDGLLCCVGVIISASSCVDQLLPPDRMVVISIVSECLSDTSSTVRQSAGQILLSLLRKLDELSGVSATNAAICSDSRQAVYLAIGQQLQDRSSQKWPQHEACLLIGEEIIRSTTLKRLEDEESRAAECDSEWLRLVEALFGMVEFSLLHDRFELRRVGAQLLPPLVRAIALYAPEMLLSYDGLACGKEVADPKSGQDQLPPRQMFTCVLVSETAKIFQHFREVLYDLDEDVVLFGCRWALEVQGRHMEDENRVGFHAALRRLCVNGDKAKQKSYLREKMQVIATQLTAMMQRVQEGWSEGEAASVSSCDYIEACTLFHAVSSSCPADCFARAMGYGSNWLLPLKSIQRAARGLRSGDGSETYHSDVRLVHSLMDPCSDSKKPISITLGCAAANRWLCDAVAPVVMVLVSSQTQSSSYCRDCRFALIIASWLLRSITDPLWLDRRPIVRKGLFESLPAFLRTCNEHHGELLHIEVLLDVADIVSQALACAVSGNKKWDNNEMYQVSKLIHTSGQLLPSLNGASMLLTDEELVATRSAALREKLRAVRDGLVQTQSSKDSVLPPPPASQAPPIDDSFDDEALDEFSDWDEEEDADMMSASESGFFACDIISIVTDIDAILKL